MSLPHTETASSCEPPEIELQLLDAVESARAAGLRYVSDSKPGIQRRRVGKHFSYIGLDGKPVHDAEAVRRIKSIGIPPAWKHVWICPHPNGHIQATGRDAKGRKQYRYYTRWREVRDETKYDKLLAFALALPAIRERVTRDMALPGLAREKVLAVVVQLLDRTSIRVGNEEYARANGSFGLTTMRSEHVDVVGAQIRFQFTGKSGKEHMVAIKDRQLAKIVKRCQDLPGHELFQYLDDAGEPHIIESDDVNAYLREVTGEPFTVKDFRTWAGTVFATQALQEIGGFDTQTQARKNVSQAIEVAAKHLGNTTTICRKCYVHPAIIEAYLDGSLLPGLERQERQAPSASLDGLHPNESMVLAFLQAQQQAE